MRIAAYIRVSTVDQHPENQRLELERYTSARGWTITQTYEDHGVSGAREKRPALDRLTADARRRRFDAVLVWKLDRLGRNLRHLLFLTEELSALGITFASLNEGIDTATATGRLQLAMIGAFAQFERDRTIERIHLGLARARAEGKRLGRRRKIPLPADRRITVREAARQWHVSPATAARRLNRGDHPTAPARETTPHAADAQTAPICLRSDGAETVRH